MMNTPFQLEQKLHNNPANGPKFAHSVQGTEYSYSLVKPEVLRALVALMDMEAVIGGAASHFGGPAAMAEMVSALFGYMFKSSDDQSKNWHELFHFVNDAGHCENVFYAVRACYEVAGLDVDSLRKFRSIESSLTGHGEAHLFPEGVYISNGPLGSGLPQAQGLAMAESLTTHPRTTLVTISDGACMEGEAKEALAAIPGLAKNGKLGPFVCIISDNNTKLSGRIDQDAFSMNPTFESLEALGWNVVKVEDGHDLSGVLKNIESAVKLAKSNKPVALWMKTIKGKGVRKTEESASGGHGFPLKTAEDLPAFVSEIMGEQELPVELKTWLETVTTPKPVKASGGAPKVHKEKIQVGIANALSEGVATHKLPIVSISADLQGSTGVAAFRKKFTECSFEVGVAESNMVSAAIGFSKQGYIPVVDTFSQFGVTKGALPLILSGLSEAPLIAVFSHTGFQDAADGASHQAITYLAQVSSIPNVDVYNLSCSSEANALLTQALLEFKTCREQGKTPRSSVFFLGRENFVPSYVDSPKYDLNKAQILKSAGIENAEKSVTIVASGSLVPKAINAHELLKEQGVESYVVQMAHVNHPDVETVSECLSKTNGVLVTLEDHRELGGMGSLLAHSLMNSGAPLSQFAAIGCPEEFGRSAYKADQLYDQYQMNEVGTVQKVLELL